MHKRPAPEGPSLTEPSESNSNPGPPDAATLAAARAFESDWAERQKLLDDSPIPRFIKAHEVALTPDEQTICGYSGIRISLGDLKALLAAVG